MKLKGVTHKNKYHNPFKYKMKPTSFNESWKYVMQTFSAFDFQNDLNFRETILSKKEYDKDSPPDQSFLTTKGKCISNNMDWNDFNQNPPEMINSRNPYDCFHGILQYIYSKSENRLNTYELEFHYPNAHRRKQLDSIDPNDRSSDRFDILNIFDYNNINTYFQVPCFEDCYFGFTFKRIKIKPLCYSIRSDNCQNRTNHLDSFTFEAYDEDFQSWVILDERVNLNDLLPPGGFGLYYVKTTNKSYSSFRIRQKEPGSNGSWGFAISAVEIHGFPTLLENQESLINDTPLPVPYSEELKLMDPLMDLSHLIFTV